MPKGNLGYRSPNRTFATTDILRELSRPTYTSNQGVSIDIENYHNPFPVIHFYVTFILGIKSFQPQNIYWDTELTTYLCKLRQAGWSQRRINGLLMSVMNRIPLGVESRKPMGRA